MDLYLQINERSTLFTVLENRKYALQRNINFGAYVLADRLIQSGYYDGEEMEQTFTRADALKKLSEEEFVFPSFSAAKLSEPDSEAAERLHSAKEMVTEGLRQLLGNLSRVMEYYHSKNQNADINAIYIGGCGAKVKGLKSFLENEFSGIEVVCLEQLPDVKISSAVSKSGINTTELIACIGAADASITFVQAAPGEKKAMYSFIVAIGLLAVCVGAAALIFIGRGKYKSEESRNERLQYSVKELEDTGIEQLESDYNNAQGNINSIIQADGTTYRNTEQWNETLKAIEDYAVSSMTVSSISQTGDTLNMNVVVRSKEEAAKLLLQFQQIPYFDSVAISAISETVDETTLYKNVSFSLAIKLKKYFNEDINGDGVVNENDDKNGDGVINELDVYGDYNRDGVTDIRDVEAAKEELRKNKMTLVANDINNDGLVDANDDVNQDGVIDSADRDAYAMIEAGLTIEDVLKLLEEQAAAEAAAEAAAAGQEGQE